MSNSPAPFCRPAGTKKRPRLTDFTLQPPCSERPPPIPSHFQLWDQRRFPPSPLSPLPSLNCSSPQWQGPDKPSAQIRSMTTRGRIYSKGYVETECGARDTHPTPFLSATTPEQCFSLFFFPLWLQQKTRKALQLPPITSFPPNMIVLHLFYLLY